MGITKSQINYVYERLSILMKQKITELNNLEFEKLSVEEKVGQILTGKAKLKLDNIPEGGAYCPIWLKNVLEGFTYENENILNTKEAIGKKEIDKAISLLKKYRDDFLDEFVLSGTGSQEIIEKFKNLDYVSGIPHVIKNND
ncbi:MAG: hypothetical protein WAX77_07100 [Methylococcaceae bacterium]